ncbi:MAG: methyl-accepting chemotaxis protein [Pleurocapsa sp.]
MTHSAAHRYIKPSDLNYQDIPLPAASWWQRQSIRFKTTVLAIAIGTIPTLAVGSIAYYFAASSIEQQSIDLRKSLVANLQNQVNLFMGDRLNDIEMMATLPIFTDPQLRNLTTSAEKSAALKKIQAAYGIYNSIAVFDAQGDLIAKSDGESLGNPLDQSYIQAALKTEEAIISQPLISTSTGIFSVYTAAPIKEQVTGATIGFVRARMPVEVLKQLLQDYTTKGSQYYLLNNQGEIFLGSSGEYVTKTLSNNSSVTNKTYDYEAVKAGTIFNGAEELFNSANLAVNTVFNIKTKTEQLVSFAPADAVEGLPALNWQTIMATDTATVFAPQRELRRILMLSTGLVTLAVGAIAYAWTKRLLRPILQAASAVQDIGQGNFKTRVEITGADEIARLGDNINLMAVQLSSLVEAQTLLAQQAQSVNKITRQLGNAVEESEIFSVALKESCQTLQSDRVIYYQFKNAHQGIVEAECVKDCTSILNTEILNPDLVTEYYAQHQNIQVKAIDNVAQANLSQSSRRQLESWQVKASLTAPVVVDNQLAGLLMIHQCSTQRTWLDEEVKFVMQVANQIGWAATRLKFLEQQKVAEIREKSAREAIQSRALSLLQEVYEVAEGNLTIRAKVTDDEIGTIADSYNSTIESLQKLVNQTKAAAIEVQLNTSANDLAVQSLAQETVTQAVAITRMLEQIQEMEQSISLVATQANQAEQLVKQATLTIDSSDQAMNRTVAQINAVQNTIAQTANKAEKLGESSQEISQAVNLISRFAAQTHLLALKASIEAARAGEQGKGFAVIAGEVRSLATQSAEATAVIETLVSKIQLETAEVVEAMNQGAEQIASGNQLVQQTRQSLMQVSQVGNEISQLVGSISQAAQLQSATSTEVSQTIVQVAAIAASNSQSATKVSGDLRQLSEIAERLQLDIGRFKT